MLQTNVSRVVEALVDEKLIRSENVFVDRGLHFRFFCKTSYGVATVDYSATCYLNLMYHRVPGSNVISVFSAVTLGRDEEIKWNHEVSHDSCWRSDNQSFNKVYFDLAKKVNGQIIASGSRQVAPIKMHNECIFDFLFDLCKFVLVEVNKDSTDEHNYRRILTAKL